MTNIFHIFLLFCYFGLLCFGGGNALTPLYIDHLVNEQHWMTLQEFGDLTAISQMTPGPIGVNAATFFGFRRGGIPGAFVGDNRASGAVIFSGDSRFALSETLGKKFSCAGDHDRNPSGNDGHDPGGASDLHADVRFQCGDSVGILARNCQKRTGNGILRASACRGDFLCGDLGCSTKAEFLL